MDVLQISMCTHVSCSNRFQEKNTSSQIDIQILDLQKLPTFLSYRYMYM